MSVIVESFNYTVGGNVISLTVPAPSGITSAVFQSFNSAVICCYICSYESKRQSKEHAQEVRLERCQ
jgi:hypothetical protein